MESSEGQPPLIERMVDALRVPQGEAGSFTLDPLRAERQLRELRLRNPLHWVLLALRAASRADAERVDARGARRTCSMEWGVTTPLPASTEALPDAALRGDPCLRLVLLAAFTGVNGGLDAVTVHSGVSLARIDRGGVSIEPAPRREGTLVVATGAIEAPVDGRRPECWVLRKRGRYLELPLFVDGELASAGVAGPPDLDALRSEEPCTAPVLLAGTTPMDGSEIRCLVDGVWVDEVSEPLLPGGAVVVVGGDLRLDSGHARVVRDDGFRAAAEAARAVGRRLDPGLGERLRDALVEEVAAQAGRELRLWPFFVAAWAATGPAVWTFMRSDGATTVEDAPQQLLLAVVLGALFAAAWTWVALHLLRLLRGLERRAWLRRRLPPHHPARALGAASRPLVGEVFGALAVGLPLLAVLAFIWGWAPEAGVDGALSPLTARLLATLTLAGWVVALSSFPLWLGGLAVRSWLEQRIDRPEPRGPFVRALARARRDPPL